MHAMVAMALSRPVNTGAASSSSGAMYSSIRRCKNNAEATFAIELRAMHSSTTSMVPLRRMM